MHHPGGNTQVHNLHYVSWRVALSLLYHTYVFLCVEFKRSTLHKLRALPRHASTSAETHGRLQPPGWMPAASSCVRADGREERKTKQLSVDQAKVVLYIVLVFWCVAAAFFLFAFVLDLRHGGVCPSSFGRAQAFLCCAVCCSTHTNPHRRKKKERWFPDAHAMHVLDWVG